MTPAEVFRAAVATAARRSLTGPRQLGACLAWAAAETLHAQAGDITIAVDRGHPVPWGASHPAAAVAEQHQFIAGTGPTTQVLRTGRPVWATRAMIGRSWPGFAAAIAQHTPYLSILAVPMASFAVLTVYYIDPEGCSSVDAGTADLVAGLATISLIGDPELVCLDDTETWTCLGGHPREMVAVAVGILTAARGIDTDAALAVLRAQAFSSSRTVDDIAAELVNG